MKATELMIGDWVMYDPNVFTDDEYETPKELYPVQIGNGEDIDLSLENCYTPIPLTQEILEKNGFVYDPDSQEPNDGWWHWKNIGVPTGNEYISIAFRDDDVAIYDLEIMKGNNWGNYHLNYLHSLQHALRLCGINKEIEI